VADLLELFDELSGEPERFIDAGDRIVVFVLAHARPRGSAAGFDIRFAQVWTMRDGKPVVCEMFPKREDALEAVGLPKVGDTTMRTRLHDIDAVIADPPQVHFAPGGVFSTDRSCYEFIAGELREEGARTLETGCGISTVLLGRWSSEHTCVVPQPGEVRACRAYLEEHGQGGSVDFEVGPSDEVLPRLTGPALDLVLIDGGHGFPTPILDWYYAAGRLRQGGVVIIDDLQLRQVRLGLMDFLDADGRWERVESTGKWAAYRRLTAGNLREEWRDQAFLDAD